MMKGYYWAMMHYLYKNDKENQYLMSEKMLSIDMPSEMELVTLSTGRKNEYAGWVDKAVEINGLYASQFRKKKGK